MEETLFVLNPYAGSGRGKKAWEQIQPLLPDLVGAYRVAETGSMAHLVEQIGLALDDGVQRVVAIGGDGTSNIVVNALMTCCTSSKERILPIFASIPAGTGRDFARSNGIPLNPKDAVHYLFTKARPHPIDIGLVQFEGHQQYFINISSAGISNDVVQRVENATKRPWTFLSSILGALLYYEPEAMRIEVDGEIFYEGESYIVVVANNISFAQGIKAAPDALLDDGLFDVVVAENTSKLDVIRILALAYQGKHIGHPKVRSTRGKSVRVMSHTGRPIGMDFDGEGSTGGMDIHFSILPVSLQILM